MASKSAKTAQEILMADFQASYMLYLSGISNAIYLQKCEK